MAFIKNVLCDHNHCDCSETLSTAIILMHYAA